MPESGLNCRPRTRLSRRSRKRSSRLRRYASKFPHKWIEGQNGLDPVRSRLRWPLECGAVPMAEICSSLVGTLGEFEQRGCGIVRGADGVVRQQEFTQLRVVESLRGTDFALAKTRRLGRRISVKHRRLEFAASGPPSQAAHFVRVCLAGHSVRAGAFGRAASREARGREIEAAPEKMYGAGLADESRAKLFEDGVNGCEDSPEAIGILRIVRVMRGIAIEANRIGNLHGHGPHFGFDSEDREIVHELFVKAGHASGNQIHYFCLTAAGRDPEHMIDEIEFHLEDSERVGNWRGGQAARADV